MKKFSCDDIIEMILLVAIIGVMVSNVILTKYYTESLAQLRHELEIANTKLDCVNTAVENIPTRVETVYIDREIPTTVYVPISTDNTVEDEIDNEVIEEIVDNRVPRTAYGRYSDADLDWFYKCVEAEETGNSYRSKYLTASCIVNRLNNGWGDTLEKVIFAKHQFEVVSNGRINRVTPTEETILACNDALDSPEEWVIAFSMGDLHSSWCNLVEVVDGEYYYREK